jgi:hypothetical protein
MSNVVRCRHCCEVIGVYEPLIAVEGSEARKTSLAAEPHLRLSGGDRYHDACYDSDAPPES